VGNFGDTGPVGEGVLELRIDSGSIGGRDTASISPGSDRWWFSSSAEETKGRSKKDIDRAKAYFEDYKARTAREKPRGRR